MNVVSGLIKEAPESPLVPSTMREHSEKTAINEELESGLTRHCIRRHLELGLLSLQKCKM